jgi:hypothetical protein
MTMLMMKLKLNGVLFNTVNYHTQCECRDIIVIMRHAFSEEYLFIELEEVRLAQSEVFLSKLRIIDNRIRMTSQWSLL